MAEGRKKGGSYESSTPNPKPSMLGSGGDRAGWSLRACYSVPAELYALTHFRPPKWALLVPMSQPADSYLNIGAVGSMSTEEALGVTISFHARPKKVYDLSEHEQSLIVRRLNKAIEWGNFRALSLDYFGHPDAASIYITVVYVNSVRRRLEIQEIGNPSVPLTERQLENIRGALDPLWDKYLSE